MRKLAILFCMLPAMAFTMGPSKTPPPLPGRSPFPVRSASPNPATLIDLRMISIDSGPTVSYKTDFGNYIQFVPFTYANDSVIPINVMGKFTITPVNAQGISVGTHLTSSYSFLQTSAKTTQQWNLSDPMPVYYGPTTYQITICVYPYDTTQEPSPLVDQKISNNCLSKIVTLVPGA